MKRKRWIGALVRSPWEGRSRVIRGGSWNSHGSTCRSANRYGHEPEYRNNNLGLRIIRVPREKP